MHNQLEVSFESITLQDQRIRGSADDYVLSVVHLVVQHPDGHVCPGCVASVRHQFREAAGDAVEIKVSPPSECAPYATRLKASIEEYYRDRVGPEGTAVRVGPRGASPWLLGMQRFARAAVSIPIGGPRRPR